MVQPYLFTLLALCASLTSAAATPENTEVSVSESLDTFYSDDLVIPDKELGQIFEEGNDLPEPEDVYGPFGPDDDRWDDDDDEGVTSSNSTGLVARDKAHFRLFRREWDYRNCGNFGQNCQDWRLDQVRIHTDCNGGGCGGSMFVDYDDEKHLCDKRFKVCGTTYWIKYSGSSPSCARMKYIARGNHGERYGKLLHDGKTKAICYFDRSRDYSRSCGPWAAESFKSLVKCVWT